ncbi:MAG: tryptophan--tRNA ligase [Patescibacteria group bacterium]|nr:tryptophan--tRNA ligase [Patescibacteria group bacterium]
MDNQKIRLNQARQGKTIFSGIQPSGTLHIGNYLGAILQWVKMQDQYNCIFCVVDYHAITTKQEPKKLNKQILDTVKIYLASGINPKKSIIFQQSGISAHTELAWILNCIARISDLNKMTQFKEKSTGKKETAGVGLYDYPVLMAADILLYNTDLVPVGEDQAQHVELCRTLARRFNQQFGNIFKIPEVKIKTESARIMGLDDPNKKMSKSADSASNYIALTDKPDIAKKKIMRAVTDSGKEIIFDQNNKPAISNLLTIYSLLSGQNIKKLETKYQGKGYNDFKKDLAEVIEKFLTSFQKKFNSFSDHEVREILKDSAEKVRPIAEETLKKVKKNIGIK